MSQYRRKKEKEKKKQTHPPSKDFYHPYQLPFFIIIMWLNAWSWFAKTKNAWSSSILEHDIPFDGLTFVCCSMLNHCCLIILMMFILKLNKVKFVRRNSYLFVVCYLFQELSMDCCYACISLYSCMWCKLLWWIKFLKFHLRVCGTHASPLSTSGKVTLNNDHTFVANFVEWWNMKNTIFYPFGYQNLLLYENFILLYP